MSWTHKSTVADVSQHCDSDSDSGTDTEIPGIVGRRRNDTSSNKNSNNEYYGYSENEQQQGYHTDNNNSSIGQNYSSRD